MLGHHSELALSTILSRGSSSCMSIRMAFHFLNIMRHFYWSSQQMQAKYFFFKVLWYSSLGKVLSENGLPQSDVLISLMIFTLHKYVNEKKDTELLHVWFNFYLKCFHILFSLKSNLMFVSPKFDQVLKEYFPSVPRTTDTQ